MTSFFISVLPVVYCGGGEISPTVKPNCRSWLEAQPMFPFSWRVWGKNFEKTHYEANILLRHMLNSAQSITRTQSIAPVGNVTKKQHLE